MIPKQTVEEILDRTNIEQLISGYVSLRRAGTNMVGLCPFHSEKTPSFTVFSGQNSFFCFGCSTGGDAVTFIRKIENLSYPDALEFLAKRAGITIMQDQSQNAFSSKPRVDRARVLAMNREVAGFYHRSLFSQDPKAQAALDYLTSKRGLSISTLRHFGLGYAPDSYTATSDYLRSKGYRDDELTEGYIAFKNERNGTLTDSFRNRVMFPIIDPAGNVIAFGGRVMDDSQPKYKNTSDTPAFKKSRNLFALNFARTHCADTIILCEGYMDVISLHAAGFENAVATLGTAITPEQARIMSRYSKKVIISYDMDAAGRKAAEKAMKLFDEIGMEVKLLKLEGAKDPDEYIKVNGAQKFRNVLESCDSKFEYNYTRITSELDITDPQQKITAVRRMTAIISHFPNATERDIYIREISKRMDIGIESLRRDVERQIAQLRKQQKEQLRQDIYQKTLGYKDPVNTEFAKAPVTARFEETVLGLMLCYPEYSELVRLGRAELSCDDFYTSFGKKVFTFIMSHTDGTEESNINEVFSPDEVGRITKMKINRMLLTENGDTVFRDSISALKRSVQRKMSESTDITPQDLMKIIAEKANNT